MLIHIQVTFYDVKLHRQHFMDTERGKSGDVSCQQETINRNAPHSPVTAGRGVYGTTASLPALRRMLQLGELTALASPSLGPCENLSSRNPACSVRP